ncbi:MAG TPA: hypothetical protein VEL74_06665 [Thermoanaerobaculia bacterium]|nr:hypothetical protein [Thermoanaerobaculia bacterium]
MEDGAFHSAGEAHCETDSGTEVVCTFAGEHFIEDVTSRLPLISRVINSDSSGDYNNYLRTLPDPDRCYIAKIWVDGFFLERGTSESHVLCNPTRPQTPPNPYTLTPTPTGGSASPIVLDLDGDGFSFTSSAGGVRFDLDLDGYKERTAWLAQVWIDASHDGASQPEELIPLADLGITSIDLDYVEARRRDRHGNELRFKSKARAHGHTLQVVDVFLQREP